MGRWTKGYAIEDTFDAVNAHNADCDAYEARIAELEAEQGRLRQIILDDGMELARVKAESLRVVVDGEAVGMDELSCNEWLLLFDGNVYYREYECGTFTTFDDRALFIATDDAVVVTPVRLERWETEE